MKTCWLVLVTGLAVLPAGCSRSAKVNQESVDPEVLQQEQDKLKGEWIGTSGGTLSVTGDRFVEEGALRNEGHFWLDPTTNPKRIDWYRTSIGGRKVSGDAVTFHAIYELTGDELRICFSGNIHMKGEKRPTEFKKRPGTQEALLTYRRPAASPRD